MYDFDDIKMKLLAHIFKQWPKYDKTKVLGAWVNTIIKNQLINIFRDIYMSTSSPCSKCPCNLGDKLCSLFGVQGSECAPYDIWTKTKKLNHDARLPLPLENHINEAFSVPDVSFDVESAANKLHIRIKAHLSVADWEIYKRIYIEHKSEELTAKELDFKTTEKGRNCGYKRIKQVSKKAVEIAKKILAEDGVESLL